MFNKSYIAYLVWIIGFYTLLIGCLLCGCLTHNTVSYAVLAPLGGITLTAITGILFMMMTDPDYKVLSFSLVLTMLIGAPLMGGFTGYTWDNYCALRNGDTLDNATFNAPLLYPNEFKFKFNKEVFVLNSMTEKYTPTNNNNKKGSGSGATWFVAPVVQCINGTTPSDTCGTIGVIGQVPVGFNVTDYAYSVIGSAPYPLWDNNQKEAARIKLFYPDIIGNLITSVKSKYSNKLNYNNDNTYLVWTNLSDLQNKWLANAVITLLVGIFTPVLFPLILFCFGLCSRT